MFSWVFNLSESVLLGKIKCNESGHHPDLIWLSTHSSCTHHKALAVCSKMYLKNRGWKGYIRLQSRAMNVDPYVLSKLHSSAVDGVCCPWMVRGFNKIHIKHLLPMSSWWMMWLQRYWKTSQRRRGALPLGRLLMAGRVDISLNSKVELWRQNTLDEVQGDSAV